MGIALEYDWVSLFAETARLRGLCFHRGAYLLRELVEQDGGGTPLAIRILEGQFATWEKPRPQHQSTWDELMSGRAPEDWIVGVTGGPRSGGNTYVEKMAASVSGACAIRWLNWRLSMIPELPDKLRHRIIAENPYLAPAIGLFKPKFVTPMEPREP